MDIQHYIVACWHNHCCHENATVCPIFPVVGTDLAVNIINVFRVATKMQQYVPFALLSSYKMRCTVFNNNKNYIL